LRGAAIHACADLNGGSHGWRHQALAAMRTAPWINADAG
jgi:hypothetical protein